MICGIIGSIEYLAAPGSAQRACDEEGRKKKFDCEIRELKVGARAAAVSFSLVAACGAAASLSVSPLHLIPLTSR